MQTYTSRNTSINSTKLPKIYNMRLVRESIIGKRILDVGGGKFNNAVKAMHKIGTTVSVYDKFNRTEKENKAALSNTYDVALCSNVLNVINSKEDRLDVIRLAMQHTDRLYVTVYEGDESGVGRETMNDCWQENRKTASYVDEINEIDGVHATLHGKVIEVTK